MSRRTRLLLVLLALCLILPMLACGLSGSGLEPPTPERMDDALLHSIDLAACSRECSGDVDCTNACVTR